jgi:hypothetical protein
VSKWSGSSFTGQSRVKSPVSHWVCEPCVHTCSRIAPVPGRPPKPGKKFGGSFRNYSHLYDAGSYNNASKGEKPAILEFLQRRKTGPWFAAIADSGQKHVLPWVPVNPGGGIAGLALFDETVVRVTDGGLKLVGAATSLLTAGATKDEIASGEYRPHTWIRCRAEVAAFEEAWSHLRGGAWFRLALWLSQRDEAQVKARQEAEKAAKKEKESGKRKRRGGSKKARRGATGGLADQDGGGDSDAARDVPRRVSRERGAQALGTPADEMRERRKKGGKPRRMGDDDAEGAEAAKSEQLSIPGLG